MSSPAPQTHTQGLAWQHIEQGLRPYVRRHVRNVADHDDIVQDVLLRVHEGLPKVRNQERLGAYVYQVVRNVIVDYARLRKRDGVSAETTPDEAPCAQEALQGDEPELNQLLAGVLGHFIEGLPPIYREALQLTELGGLTQAEAADRASVSLSTMKSRVQRARRELRSALMVCCAIEVDRRGGVLACTPRTRAPCSGCA